MESKSIFENEIEGNPDKGLENPTFRMESKIIFETPIQPKGGPRLKV